MAVLHGMIGQLVLSCAVMRCDVVVRRYVRFIVCLAHRVIALWFIRSRLQYRKTVAHFIIKVSLCGREE